MSADATSWQCLWGLKKRRSCMRLEEDPVWVWKGIMGQLGSGSWASSEKGSAIVHILCPDKPRHLQIWSIHDQDFTMHELNRVLQVNEKSAPGSDGVHRSMLHHTGPGARQILLAFINKLYKDRRLPSTWKQAEQVPIPKPESVMHLDPFHYLVAFLKPWKAWCLTEHWG